MQKLTQRIFVEPYIRKIIILSDFEVGLPLNESESWYVITSCEAFIEKKKAHLHSYYKNYAIPSIILKEGIYFLHNLDKDI